jgi:hypothetical protein
MGTILCVSPEAPAPAPDVGKATSQAASTGLRLGLLDNSKSNADHLLRFLADAAGESIAISAVVRERKYSASRPLDDAALDKLARETDFVLSAMAD